VFALFATVTVGLRVAIQIRRTGSSGFHRFRGEPGSLEWLAGLLFIISVFAAPLAPILVLLDVLEPIAALNTQALNIFSIVLSSVGTILVFAAQMAMGDSWRVGVKPEERTELVTTGIFGIVRNPIFAVTIPTLVGFALMVPTILAFVVLFTALLSLELLVRFVEEPYLIHTHGSVYRDYAARVGRFLPGVGLIDATVPDATVSEPR